VTRRRQLSTAVLTVASAFLAACGSDDSAGGDDGPRLSAEAQRGADIAEDRGCESCHQSEGLGPSWDGLYGSTVALVGGSTVVADDDYLAESISDPGAKLVEGYDIAMPPNELSDDEVASVVAYIRELGDSSPEPSTGTAT
jgi:cytochrome c oxidase subunit II